MRDSRFKKCILVPNRPTSSRLKFCIARLWTKVLLSSVSMVSMGMVLCAAVHCCITDNFHVLLFLRQTSHVKLAGFCSNTPSVARGLPNARNCVALYGLHRHKRP